MATDSILAPKGALFLNSHKAHSKNNRPYACGKIYNAYSICYFVSCA